MNINEQEKTKKTKKRRAKLAEYTECQRRSCLAKKQKSCLFLKQCQTYMLLQSLLKTQSFRCDSFMYTSCRFKTWTPVQEHTTFDMLPVLFEFCSFSFVPCFVLFYKGTLPLHQKGSSALNRAFKSYPLTFLSGFAIEIHRYVYSMCGFILNKLSIFSLSSHYFFHKYCF